MRKHNLGEINVFYFITTYPLAASGNGESSGLIWKAERSHKYQRAEKCNSRSWNEPSPHPKPGERSHSVWYRSLEIYPIWESICYPQPLILCRYREASDLNEVMRQGAPCTDGQSVIKPENRVKICLKGNLQKRCIVHSTFILDHLKRAFKLIVLCILLRLESGTFYESQWQQGRMSGIRMNIKRLDM